MNIFICTYTDANMGYMLVLNFCDVKSTQFYFWLCSFYLSDGSMPLYSFCFLILTIMWIHLLTVSQLVTLDAWLISLNGGCFLACCLFTFIFFLFGFCFHKKSIPTFHVFFCIERNYASQVITWFLILSSYSIDDGTFELYCQAYDIF